MTSRIVESQPPDPAWNEAEGELLAAARADRMPAELEARLREALDFPASPGADAALRPALNDSATPTPLFASKLPLWGVLGIVAIGVVSYYTLSSSKPQPSAAASSAAAVAVPRHAARDLPPDQASTAQHAPDAHQPAPSAQRSAAAGASARVGEGLSAQQSAAVGALARGEGEGREPAPSAQHSAVARKASERGVREGREPASVQRSAAAHASARGGSGELEAARGRGSAAPGALAARPERGELALRRGAAQAGERGAGDRSVPAAESGKSATPDQLRTEAALLEHARSALGQGALSEARRWLARYRAQFAHGALRPESQVLGIELAARAGESATAKTQADDFLARYPNHPLRDRVRQLTAYGVGVR